MAEHKVFGKPQCQPISAFQDITGHVLALKPEALSEEFRTPENQLFLAQKLLGLNDIAGKFLVDGVKDQFSREDFLGALDPNFLPDWAIAKMAAPEPVHVRVFQINRDRDTEHRCFEPFEPGQAVNPAIYDEVYSGLVPSGEPEAIFQQFNTSPPPLHRGWSMSPSDVIEANRTHFYVDRFGFQEIGFDASLTQKPEGLRRVVMIEPGLPAYSTDIAPSLEAMQRAVGGLIEVTYPFDDEHAVMVGNEEAKLLDMPGNRRLNGGVYAGPLFIIGDDGEGGFCSLTDEQIAEYTEQFAVPEEITMEEVQADMRIEFHAW